MKILITGSTGGIGSNICEHLEKNNIEVIKLKIDLSEDFDLNIDNIDGLIHCAGINYLSSFKGIDYENFNKILQVNSISFIKLCQKVKFNKKANIIAIGSLYATSVKPDRMMYSFSKHALLAAVKTLALEMSNDKIKVNMISPGFVDTPLTRKNNTQTRIDQLDSIIPLGLTDADEIAKMCLYLLKENKAITGQNLIIDGGYSCLEI
jgi:NAD(P)-dependent dehydrogenase (short-subunit alcohol dehydrogenase family)